jgi:predicted alpha/beta-hydrolase family hydrolase
VRVTHTEAVTNQLEVSIEVGKGARVSGILQRPADARALYVLAHGAGAGMRHPFMASIAEGLCALGIATLRYQFPYMERGGKRPDSPELCHATVRGAVGLAHQLEPALPMIAGGKSFGGRMTSQAQAVSPLPGVRGLAFLGFPLHPPKQPSSVRAEHLSLVRIPMLFLQGTRDALAEPALMAALLEKLGTLASLTLIENADHSFHVAARTGRTDQQVRDGLIETFTAWAATIIGPRPAASS